MKVMVIVKATKSSEAGELPSEELMKEMGRFNEELVRAGIMKDGDGLRPSAQGKRVHFRGRERTISDGPFAETKELIAGYWIWEVTSMQEAVDWVSRCPNPMPDDSDIEIRPIATFEDYAASDPTGEVQALEAQLAAPIAMRDATVTPYLFFGGRCEEALEFYEQAVGAVVQMKMRFDESPDPVPAGMLQAGFESKIMHATFRVGKMNVMASDGLKDDSGFDGFRLALTVESESECDRVFTALSAGGTIDVPLMKTFWSPRYGMMTDKFGVGWMVMVAGEQQ